MQKTKSRSFWTWAGALAAGCGLCCLPLIVPLFGGAAVAAGGASLALGGGGWLEVVLCVLALVVIGVGVFWFLRRAKRRQAEVCTPNVDPEASATRVKVKPLD